jgi:Fe-S-cluster containining protein
MVKARLCEKCTGLCCRYFALPIETPESREDFDDVRWYLCHKDISVFVEEGDWYINIKNRCKYLSGNDYRCRIYAERPRICRQYKTSDCDQVDGSYNFEHHFTSDKQLSEYVEEKFAKPSRKKTARRKRKRKTK